MDIHHNFNGGTGISGDHKMTRSKAWQVTFLSCTAFWFFVGVMWFGLR